MFFIDLELDDRANEIYEVTSLMHMRVEIESPKPKVNVVQCHQCQRLGHTKGYCTWTLVCVKCGEEHIWSECRKRADAKPTCGICGGDHTTNYRGCPEIKKATPAGPNKSTTQPQRNWFTAAVDPTKTYAKVTHTSSETRSTRTSTKEPANTSSESTGTGTIPINIENPEYSELTSCLKQL